ncbi:MAG TPA: hypothetical protein VHD14_06525 [Pseudolabrys sp.]|jgi:hypothetical protein|nr:hypothetical protein [Pseudolabrys sp.]
MRSFNKVGRASLIVLSLGGLLAACADNVGYLDRRDTIALSGGNAVATDTVAQMVDPWPRASANRSIAYNGQKMQSAVERYRNNKVTPPVGIGTSSSYSQQSSGQGSNNSANATPVGPTVTQTAAPVN